jgi:hypothetical protein
MFPQIIFDPDILPGQFNILAEPGDVPGVTQVSETADEKQSADHCARAPRFGAVVAIGGCRGCKNRAPEHVDHCAKGSKKLAQWSSLAQWSGGHCRLRDSRKRVAEWECCVRTAG